LYPSSLQWNLYSQTAGVLLLLRVVEVDVLPVCVGVDVLPVCVGVDVFTCLVSV